MNIGDRVPSPLDENPNPIEPQERHSDPWSAHEGAAKAAQNDQDIFDAILMVIPPSGLTGEQVSEFTGIKETITSSALTRMWKMGMLTPKAAATIE
jgi:hypothetical protein